MIVLGCDVGASVGLALALDGAPIWAMPVRRCDTAVGRIQLRHALEDDTRLLILGNERPDRIVIEKPTRNPKSKIDDYATLCERAGEMVALCEVVFPGVRILRPWPLDRNGTKGWQSIKADDPGKDSKDRSRSAVARILRGREDEVSQAVLRVCRDSDDCADAVLIACFGALQKG